MTHHVASKRVHMVPLAQGSPSDKMDVAPTNKEEAGNQFRHGVLLFVMLLNLQANLPVDKPTKETDYVQAMVS